MVGWGDGVGYECRCGVVFCTFVICVYFGPWRFVRTVACPVLSLFFLFFPSVVFFDGALSTMNGVNTYAVSNTDIYIFKHEFKVCSARVSLIITALTLSSNSPPPPPPPKCVGGIIASV